MTKRYTKWFTISPSWATSGSATAVYNGEYNGVRDPYRNEVGEENVGRSFNVMMISATKLYAPNPPFESPESFVDDLATNSDISWFTPTEQNRIGLQMAVYNGKDESNNIDPRLSEIGEENVGKTFLILKLENGKVYVPKKSIQN